MKKCKSSILVFLMLAFLTTVPLYAQEKDKTLPKANKEYTQSKFIEAEANYRISASKFPNQATAPYNLGNAIYKQKQSSEAKFAYAKAVRNSNTRTEKHRAFHNLGNVFMNEKDYTQAVEAYKNALRNNPTDEQTRYNYALAKKMLKDNPPKQDKNKDDKKDKDKKDDKKDPEKDKKDNKDTDKDKKDKKDKKDDQDKQKKDPKPEDKAEPKPQPSGLSKERLENLLEAVNKEEKKVQDKVNAQKVKGKPVKTEKDW